MRLGLCEVSASAVEPTSTDLATRSERVPRRYLIRYRVLAFATATLLIVLVFVGIPLQVAANRPAVVNDVGTIHGLLYIVYLFVAFGLTKRLSIPRWQMALVLLAGTVPFAAFVAERKMTHRFEAANRLDTTGAPAAPVVPAEHDERTAEFRRRWLSRRALLLDLEVLILAPGCAVAGWWQATRALAGNGLSWFYSVEWPVFAILAVWGWWYLIHEDPEVYAARRWFRGSSGDSLAGSTVATDSVVQLTVRKAIANLARVLLALIGLDIAFGFGALALLPFHRATGVLPAQQRGIYVAHAALGLPLLVGAFVLLARTLHASRVSRLTGWIGMVGIVVAGLGGLLTASNPLRLFGMAVMLLGAFVAAFGYLLPSFEKLRE
jgi:integral membrane protein